MTRNTASQDTSFSVNIFTEEYYDNTELKLSSFNCKTSLSLYYANNKEWITEWWCVLSLQKNKWVLESNVTYDVLDKEPLISENTEFVIKEHILKNSKKKIPLKWH